MSLINDALKRASQSQKQPATPVREATPGARPVAPVKQVSATPENVPVMQTVETARRSSAPIVALVVVIVILLGIVGVVLMRPAGGEKGNGRESSPVAAAKPTAPVMTAPAIKAVEPEKSKAVSAPKAIAPTVAVAVNPVEPAKAAMVAPVENKPAAPVIATAPANDVPAVPTPQPTVAVVPATPPAPTFPAIKLQGIFFRKSNPTVMLNGKTLPLGASIEGVRITKIEQLAVTLEWNGQVKVLELSE